MNPICSKCSVPMEKQDYRRPYTTASGRILSKTVEVNIYICPCCGKEIEQLVNEEDGYSAGAGLFSEE